MGNRVSSRPSQNDTVKVILSDGTVHEFDKPLAAAELMLEHPQQVVVEFHPETVASSKRPSPLPADEKLETKKVYLMLPMRRGKPAALTAEESRRILLSANAVLRTRGLMCYTGVLPVIARVCQAAAVAVVTGDQGQRFVVQKKENIAAENRLPELLPESVGPEYFRRQVSGKGWKPSLDTIKEKKVETKVSHWLY